MATDLYLPHAIKFASGNAITQIDNLSPDFGLEDLTVYSASEILPGFTGSMSHQPALMASTTQIADILDRCDTPSTGPVCGAFSSSNIDIEWRLMSNLTGRVAAATTSHKRTRSTHALLCWESISGSIGSLANVSFRLEPISNSGAAPWSYTSGVALGATSAVQAVYEPGPVVLDGSTLCAQGWSWNNGLSYQRRRCGSSAYVEFLAVDRVRPVVTVDVEDVTTALALIPAGGALTSLVCYLRKKNQSGINVADGTATHIALSGSVGTVKPRNPKQLEIHLHSFSFDTTSAIS